MSFLDNFEGATIVPPWDAVIAVNGTVDLSAANPKFGTKHLRCQSLGTIVSRVCVSKTFAAAQQKYVAFYFEHVSGPFDPSALLTLVALYPDINVPANYYGLVTIVDGKLQIRYRHAAGFQVVQTNVALPTGYHELELGVKIGNGTGEVHVLLDNIPIFDITGLVNNEWTGVASARVGIAYTNNISPHVVDIDQAALADAPIGPYIPPDGGGGFFKWTFPLLTWLRSILKLPAESVAAYGYDEDAA